MTLRAGRVVALGLVLVVAGGGAVPAGAGSAAPADGHGGPRIEVEPTSAQPGEPVQVRLTGWGSVAATVTVCGNLALRGSADCDVRAGVGVPLAATGGDASAQLMVTEPPAPCPCVVRASSGSHDEVATAPLDIVGAPVAPVVEPENPGPLLAVTVDARRASPGIVDRVRAALGGPVVYEVEVTVRNRTAAPLGSVRVAGRARSWSSDDAASFAAEPGSLDPGQTWSHRTLVEVPAPSIGELRWEAVASGAGPAVGAERATTNVPVALLAMVALLAGDLAAIACRATRRLRARHADSDAGTAPACSSISVAV